jgi:hypothetical protein
LAVAEELFSDEEDAEIVSFIEAQQRCRWTELQRRMPNRTKNSLKHRYSLLHIGSLNGWRCDLRQEFAAEVQDAEIVKVSGVPRPTLEAPATALEAVMTPQRAAIGWVAFTHECERDPAFHGGQFSSCKARAAAISAAWLRLSEAERQTYGAKAQTHRVKTPSTKGRKRKAKTRDSDDEDGW